MTKIKETYENSILKEEELEELLHRGDFYRFENMLLQKMMAIYDATVSYFLEKVSKSVAFNEKLRELANKLGLKKLSNRSVRVQIASGSYVHYTSMYAEQASDSYKGDRSLSRLYLAVFKNKFRSEPRISVTGISVKCADTLICHCTRCIKKFELCESS